MGICGSAPENRFPEVQKSYNSKFSEESSLKHVDGSSKLPARHAIKLGSVDLDRSARDGAAFLLRPSMQYQGPHSPHNPSVHAVKRSSTAEASVHRGHASVTASGDQLRRPRASYSASADSSAHKIPSIPSVFCSQPNVCAGSVGAADLNPSSSGKLRHRRLQDMEAQGKRMSADSGSRMGLDQAGSAHSAVASPVESLPRTASLAKGSRQGSQGVDNTNFFVGSPVDGFSSKSRPPSQLPDAHTPVGQEPQPEHDSESVMLIAELSDHGSEGFLDEDGRGPIDRDSLEHQSSLASMFDEDAAAFVGGAPAGTVQTGGGGPPDRTANEMDRSSGDNARSSIDQPNSVQRIVNKVPSKTERQQLSPGPITYRHSISGEIKGHVPGSLHLRTNPSDAPSHSPACSLQKSLGRSSGHRPSRLGTPSPGATPLHSGPQIPLAEIEEHSSRGSRGSSNRHSGPVRKQKGQLATHDMQAMQMALELSALLGSPQPKFGHDEPPGCGPEDLPTVASSRDHHEADHIKFGSPFKASQVQELDMVDPPRTSPGSDGQTPSPTTMRRQSSRLNRSGINVNKSPTKSGSINSQASSQPSPRPHGFGPVLSPKSSGEGLANSLHSLRALGSQLFKSKSTNEPARQDSSRAEPRSSDKQHSDPSLCRPRPLSLRELDHDADGLAVGSPPGLKGPVSTGAVNMPQRAPLNTDRGSANRDMPASLNQWAQGTATPVCSSPPGIACRQARQQKQPSQQQFLSGSPGGLGNALGSPLVGARCSSYRELSRDADELTALSYFSRGSAINQRQGCSVSGAARTPPAASHKSASCHGGSAFYSSTAPPSNVRPMSGSVHGGSAFGSPKVPFSFPHAPFAEPGVQDGSGAVPKLRRASITSPTSSNSQSQTTRIGLSSLPSTSPPPTSESLHGSTAHHSQPHAQSNQSRPKVMFGSQHGGSLYKDYADKVQQHLANSHVFPVVGNSGGRGHARSIPQDIAKAAASGAISGGHAMTAVEEHSGTSPGALQSGHLERAQSSPNASGNFCGPPSPRLLTPFLPEWLDSSQRGGSPR